MTVVLDHENTERPPESTESTVELASWGARAGAFGLDVMAGLAVFAAPVLIGWATPQQEWRWWVCVTAAALVLLAVAANRWLLPVLTGWSLGRSVFGIAVVGRSGDMPGPWLLLGRDAAHLLDTAALSIGWLWPLWDNRRRTFADMVARTEVRVRRPSPPGALKTAARVAAIGALVAALTAVLGYATIYRADLSERQAREQLAAQGPQLVLDMLSYRKETLEADFDRARSVVTDAYRPELQAQQDSVRQGEIVDNEYWAPNATVLHNTGDRGTMLVLLQGQRGVEPDFHTLSATVEVDFERSEDGNWKVAGLTPVPARGGR